MRYSLLLSLSCFLIVQTFAGLCVAQERAEIEKRRFEFQYGATVTDLPADAKVVVWIPIAETSYHQLVELNEVSTPTPATIARDEKYGNKMARFELDAPETGQFAFNLNYNITRGVASKYDEGNGIDEETRNRFLTANANVPIDGAPMELIEDKEIPDVELEAGEMLYEVVEQYMAYDKSKPGYGDGNVLWACDSKTGNCTDFHSVFISLARSQNLPARFEIGFPIGTDPSGIVKGYHCWAWFYADDHGWVPVDISEADKHPEMKEFYFGKLTKDRVAFSVGRDIPLIEKPEVKLNYFVYPYVEVNGEPLAKENIKLDFSYTDIE